MNNLQVLIASKPSKLEKQEKRERLENSKIKKLQVLLKLRNNKLVLAMVRNHTKQGRVYR